MKIFLIDDHTLFRTGIAALLQTHNITVNAAETVDDQMFTTIIELEPDIILLDLRMPTMDGIQVLHHLKKLNISTPVVMLTTSEADQDLFACLKLGAKGYLLKTIEADDLINSLNKVMAGETIVDQSLTTTLAKMASGEITETSSIQNELQSKLTPREYEILQHLAEGQSNKVIGRNLGISDGTVKLHVKAVLRKLEVQSRVEAAVMAVEHGIRKNKNPLGQ